MIAQSRSYGNLLRSSASQKDTQKIHFLQQNKRFRCNARLATAEWFVWGSQRNDEVCVIRSCINQQYRLCLKPWRV